MRITLAQLEAFACVARVGTVREASRQLNRTQPTISLRLGDLERALGSPLFERTGRSLRLLQSSVGILEHANRILVEVGKLKGRAGSDEINGRVRLGISESFAVAGLPSLLKLVSADYPDLRVDLAIGPSSDLIDELCERHLDLVIVVNPTDDTRLRVIPLGVQPSTWAAAPQLDLPQVIRPKDIMHQTILMNPIPHPNYRQTMEWFGTAGIEPVRTSLCNTVPSVIAHLVESGIGVAILPTKLIEPQLNAGTLVSLNCRPIIQRAHLCAVRGADDREPALDAVLEAVRRILRQFNLLEGAVK